jgi:hypothetical protein
MSTIKIIINKSQVPAIKPGSILMWNEDITDFTFTPGDSRIEAIVVYGSSQYTNGKKLTLFVAAPFASLSKAPQNRIPFGAQYQKRY